VCHVIPSLARGGQIENLDNHMFADQLFMDNHMISCFDYLEIVPNEEKQLAFGSNAD
jgi:hypothetical protein